MSKRPNKNFQEAYIEHDDVVRTDMREVSLGQFK